MTLTGVSPTNPRPAIRREFVFAAGASSGQSPDRPVLIFGNKTSAGSETLNVIGDPIADDADCIARFGIRSEIYAMYRKFVEVPQEAKIYAVATTESGGTAAAVLFTVSGASDASSTFKFHAHGVYFEVPVQSGDTAQTTAAAIAAAFNAADDGKLQMTATSAIIGGGPDYGATITYSHKGLRGNQVMGSTTNYGLRVKAIGTNSQTVTKTNGSYVSGATEDDMSSGITEMTNGEYYYQITPKYDTSTPTATDNGIGEHLLAIKTQSLPINGKDQVLFAGYVGTSTQAAAYAADSEANSVFFRLFWQENSDWSPGMIAAHCCGVVRQQEMAHPAANVNGWTATDTQIFTMPAPYLKADIPSNAEIVQCLDSGVCPISYVGNRVVLERHITSRCLSSLGTYDYRAREGHITSVMHFFWAIAKQRYISIRQPFADERPTGTNISPKKTTTPTDIITMLELLIDDFCSDNPLGGIYEGPILKTSARDEMKQSITCTYDGRGGFPSSVNLQAVQHNIKWEHTQREVSDAY